MTAIAKLYLKYRKLDLLQGVLKSLRPAVVALIASAGVSILKNAFLEAGSVLSVTGINIPLFVIFLICLILLCWKKWNPIIVMLLAGILNVIFCYVK